MKSTIKLPCGIQGESCAKSCFHIVVRGGYKKEYADKIDACYKKYKIENSKKIKVSQMKKDMKYKRNRQRGDV